MLFVRNMLALRFITTIILALLFTECMVNATVADKPTPQLVGVSDLQGNEIIPAKYSRIEYKENGIFLASDSVNGITDLYGFNGSKLKYSLPPGAKFVDVHWKKLLLKIAEAEFKEVPDNLLISFQRNGGIGLCNGRGETLLLPEYSKIGFAGEGYLFLLKPSRSQTSNYICWLLDTETFKTIRLTSRVKEIVFPMSEGRAVLRPARNPSSMGFVDNQGKVKVFKNYRSASPFRNGTCSVFVHGQDDIGLLIDRDYNVLSSQKLKIKKYYEGLAVALCPGSEPARYGLIDKDFNWIVLPKYKTIEPIFESCHFGNKKNRRPEFYVAVDSSHRELVMSLKGEILGSFPEKLNSRSLIYHDGVITCYSMGSKTTKIKRHMFRLKDRKIKRKNEEILEPLFKELAPGRVLKQVSRVDGSA